MFWSLARSPYFFQVAAKYNEIGAKATEKKVIMISTPMVLQLDPYKASWIAAAGAKTWTPTHLPQPTQ